ncbi:ribonuclease T2-A-like isoform X2 [Heterodontus francisci]|uniref:ribonuclease T2-A-like isoform X2 n=1 Tax=Heterodontus francisci TaxID=7792 RepID=UPI00355AF854
MALFLILLTVLSVTDCSVILKWEQQRTNCVLAIQWPPKICQLNSWNGNACQNHYWTIHGFWPKTESCNGKKYNQSAMKPLRKVMNEFWPNLTGRRNDDFWKKQWEKHGKCAVQHFSQCEYFKRALDYYKIVFANCKKTERPKINEGEIRINLLPDCV